MAPLHGGWKIEDSFRKEMFYHNMFRFHLPDVDCVGESLPKAVDLELVVVDVDVGWGGPVLGRERGRPLEVEDEVLGGERTLINDHLSLLILTVLLGLWIIFHVNHLL